jgi:hypothetical protein
VTSFAVCLAFVLSGWTFTTQHVFPVGGYAQVVRIATTGVFTQVVDNQTFRDRTSQQLPSEAMHTGWLAVDRNFPITQRVTITLPIPATFLIQSNVVVKLVNDVCFVVLSHVVTLNKFMRFGQVL